MCNFNCNNCCRNNCSGCNNWFNNQANLFNDFGWNNRNGCDCNSCGCGNNRNSCGCGYGSCSGMQNRNNLNGMPVFLIWNNRNNGCGCNN